MCVVGSEQQRSAVVEGQGSRADISRAAGRSGNLRLAGCGKRGAGVVGNDPLARRTRTIKRCSSDARSWDHPTYPLKVTTRLRPCPRNGASWRAGVGRVRSLAFLSILHVISMLLHGVYEPRIFCETEYSAFC